MVWENGEAEEREIYIYTYPASRTCNLPPEIRLTELLNTFNTSPMGESPFGKMREEMLCFAFSGRSEPPEPCRKLGGYSRDHNNLFRIARI